MKVFKVQRYIYTKPNQQANFVIPHLLGHPEIKQQEMQHILTSIQKRNITTSPEYVSDKLVMVGVRRILIKL